MGREFVVSVPHRLPQEEALSRVKSLMAALRAQYGSQVGSVTESWDGYSCNFSMKLKMFKLAGSIAVEPSSAEIRGTMPPGTGRFEGRAKAMIEERAKELLA